MNDQVDDDIWNFPEYSSNYNSLEYGSENMLLLSSSESSNEHRNSLTETEPFQIDTMPFLVEDYAPQNMSDESNLEDHKDTSFNTFHMQHLLLLILYSDATTLDHMGKSSGHSIFLLLENVPNYQRNKPEAKTLIGYFPILKPRILK
ncbi:hypothetical protein C2G38_2159899 [Gigaspora rosea]|uniref:Uncharacterized protein n=1 Tax=Gigaspora rosea TaxID=44941 RepID=A0A397VYW9_9GLOM|nr:hypothetical protein C2G38_2159899 [Gigaspora rosea]